MTEAESDTQRHKQRQRQTGRDRQGSDRCRHKVAQVKEETDTQAKTEQAVTDTESDTQRYR